MTCIVGGQTRNPFALEYSPGGSSGGSAAAVVSNFAVVGIGTDTGGSIRIPSSFNNLIGLRPTQDLVSVQGVVPLSHSRDTVGPIVRYSADAAIVMDAIVSKEKKRQFVAPRIYGSKIPKRLRSCVLGGRFQLHVNQSKIGLMESLLGTTAGIREAVLNAVDRLETAGAVIVRMKKATITKKSLSKHKSSSFWEFADDLADYLQDRTSDTPKRNAIPSDLSTVVKVRQLKVLLRSRCIVLTNLVTAVDPERFDSKCFGKEVEVREVQTTNEFYSSIGI